MNLCGLTKKHFSRRPKQKTVYVIGALKVNHNPFDCKGPVTLSRIAPTYADVRKIQQLRWYTLSTLEISFKHVTNTL